MRKTLLAAATAAGLLLLAACGAADNNQDSGKEPDVSAETAAASVQTSQSLDVNENGTIEFQDAAGETVSFEEAPASAAALSGGDLDMLLALGANVVGRPSSQGPAADELKEIQEIGNPHQPNFEKIAEVHPDVLVASASFKQHAANLEAQGTKVVYTAANSVDDILQTIGNFGQMLGKQDEAEELTMQIEDKMDQAAGQAEKRGVKTLLVYGAPGSYLAALPNSLSGDLLERAGGENIASDLPKEDNYPQYASLSTEKIIERNPEAVMLITHGDPEAVKSAFEGEMAKNPAWKNLDAVKNGKVTVLPSHLFGTNPGTKVADAFDVMIESLKEAEAK
ncbi:ABC transporter substrate-binding protein [Sporosarcina trichiuri]|uniref:ABC transporter substrate-binding protein n=1 Tax=Sporosarcina trichiuri TaxID=3056445 RepID=UPI0025B4A61D|nr:ABC transporter substrate-binding protein [Sporosarcina sp. 0.2-SM1T-5]WJY26251.1 ABC transporter substrate-binding protein [Sporosarcina sp. 0.2-SM1T-5]